ncbi:MAG: hypothetical protein WDW38_006301 [Sanguina aurantia]
MDSGSSEQPRHLGLDERCHAAEPAADTHPASTDALDAGDDALESAAGGNTAQQTLDTQERSTSTQGGQSMVGGVPAQLVSQPATSEPQHGGGGGTEAPPQLGDGMLDPVLVFDAVVSGAPVVQELGTGSKGSSEVAVVGLPVELSSSSGPGLQAEAEAVQAAAPVGGSPVALQESGPG